MPVKALAEREAGGYQYRDDSLNVVHTTSAPMNDEEAFEYFKLVEGWLPGTKVQFIEKRPLGGAKYAIMDVQYVDGKVIQL